MMILNRVSGVVGYFGKAYGLAEVWVNVGNFGEWRIHNGEGAGVKVM